MRHPLPLGGAAVRMNAQSQHYICAAWWQWESQMCTGAAAVFLSVCWNVCLHEHDISNRYLARRPGWLWKLVCPAASSQRWLRWRAGLRQQLPAWAEQLCPLHALGQAFPSHIQALPLPSRPFQPPANMACMSVCAYPAYQLRRSHIAQICSCSGRDRQVALPCIQGIAGSMPCTVLGCLPVAALGAPQMEMLPPLPFLPHQPHLQTVSMWHSEAQAWIGPPCMTLKIWGRFVTGMDCKGDLIPLHTNHHPCRLFVMLVHSLLTYSMSQGAHSSASSCWPTSQLLPSCGWCEEGLQQAACSV